MQNNTTTDPVNYIVNASTGEITNTTYQGDRLTIARQSQLQYANDHLQNFNSGKTFVKIYDEIIPLLEKYLSSAEFKFVICLIPHVSYEDCIIRKTMDRKSKILTQKEIAQLHNYKYDYVRKIMASLKNKGVIGKHETGSILNCSGNDNIAESNIAYTVNPYIYFRGSDIITPIHAFYSGSGWKELLANN